ncbi:unnamed protein product [Lathyrus sativus]|nr:unnamed protein product [Lathyrus sativus]
MLSVFIPNVCSFKQCGLMRLCLAHYWKLSVVLFDQKVEPYQPLDMVSKLSGQRRRNLKVEFAGFKWEMRS